MKTAEEIKIQKAKYYAANADKIKAQHAAYNAANSEKIKLRSVVWYVNNAEKLKAYQAARYASGEILATRRMKKYGLTPEAFQAMLLTQKNACAICKEIFSKEPHLDHCHKTGRVRGILCSFCNRGLGNFRDSREILENAKKYLL